MALLCHSWFGPDVWYHLTWGRSLLETESFFPHVQTLIPQPVTANMYWLFQMALYLTYRAGSIYAVSAAFALLWLCVWRNWCLLLAVRRPGLWSGLLALCFILLIQLRFEARPEIISYALLSALLLILIDLDFAQPIAKTTYAVVFLLQAIWANCHGFAFFGVLVVAVHALLEVRRSWRRGFALVTVALAGWLCTPFGLKLVFALMDYADVARGLSHINAELMAPTVWPPSFPFSLIWILFALNTGWILNCLWRRRAFKAVVYATLGMILMVTAVRNIPLFLILSAPLWRDLLSRERPFSWRIRFLPAVGAWALTGWVVLGGYQDWTRSFGSFGIYLEPSAYPIAAVEALKRLEFHGSLFADSYDGGFIEFTMPDVHVAGDSYFSSVTETLRYFAAIKDPSALQQLEHDYPFDGLLINIENRAEVEAILHDPNWNLVYADLYRLLWIRTGQAVKLSALGFSQKGPLRWMDRFALASWGDLAFRERDRELMLNLCRDFQFSERVPQDFVAAALSLAVLRRDHALAATALNLNYGKEPSSPEMRKLIELAKPL